MNFVSKLFGRGKQAAVSEKQALEACEAIQLARQGRIPVTDMLGCLVAGKLFVPLSAPPEMDAQSIKSWRPATVSKGDGSQWLVVFTDAEASSQFSTSNRIYSYGMSVDARWVLRAVPPGHGVVINMDSAESMFEWSADGISRYKAEVLA